jgi:hypothetical protein
VRPYDPNLWPPSVPVANREQCTLRCITSGGGALDDTYENQVRTKLSRHLGAARACTEGSNDARPPPFAVVFDTMGSSAIYYEVASRSTSVQQCFSRIPPPPRLQGPYNARWKCTDYCP